MAVIKVAPGHNNTASLSTFSVEPWQPQIQLGLVKISLSESVSEDGKRQALLIWEPEVPATVVTNALVTLGLGEDTLSATVTASLYKNSDRTTVSNHNATAVWTPAPYRMGSHRGFTVRLIALEAI